MTAPEIALALHMGAEITVLDGVVIPWIEDSKRPFELVIRDFSKRRNAHPKGSIENEMFKQLGNSLYGKLAQGISGSTAFNTRDLRQEVVKPSAVTNPYLAAHVTGLIRALISEMIASIPERFSVISVTTDGFVTNTPIGDIDLTGPVATHLTRVRSELTDTPERQDIYELGRGLLEQKFAARRLLPWRTRGIATLVPEPDQKPKLARGGMREPNGTKAANSWFVYMMLDREPGQKWTNSEALPFPVAHRKNADLVFRDTRRTMNFEYDFKRQLVDPARKFVPLPRFSDDEAVTILQHIACNTIPWKTVAEFQATRDLFEQWRQKQKGQLRTMADWCRWEEFRAGTEASRLGIRRGRAGIVGQALTIFLRAYVRSHWGLPGGSYKKAAAALTLAGYPTTEQGFKNALRSKDKAPPEHVIPADAPGIRDFVRAVLSIWPEFGWERLVLDPPPDYLRQIDPEPQVKSAENGGNAGEFQSAV